MWKRQSSHNRAKRWGPIHDSIIHYGGGPTWNRVLQPLDRDYVERFYRHSDERGQYRVDNLTGPSTRTEKRPPSSIYTKSVNRGRG